MSPDPRQFTACTHKANGAGIAADPTLTCAWALCFLRLVRQASPFACPAAHLATGVFLASSCVFQFSALASFFLPSPLCFAGFHRRSRRHPTLLRIACFPSGPAGAFPSFQHATLHSRDHYPGVGKSNTCRLSPEGSFLKLSPAKTAALNGCIASHLSQTIRPALHRSSMHAFSRQLRGQQQPCLCFK